MACAGCRKGDPVKGYVDGDTFYIKDALPEEVTLLQVNEVASHDVRYYKVHGRQYSAGRYITKIQVLNEDVDYMLAIKIKSKQAFSLYPLPLAQETVSIQPEEEVYVAESEQVLQEDNEIVAQADSPVDEVLQEDAAPKRRKKRKSKAVDIDFSEPEFELDEE